MINTEQLAEELHKFYRAAFKAMTKMGLASRTSLAQPMSHDHGWSHCNKKKYFLRRAISMARELQYVEK